jgi:hypothetical protein
MYGTQNRGIDDLLPPPYPVSLAKLRLWEPRVLCLHILEWNGCSCWTYGIKEEEEKVEEEVVEEEVIARAASELMSQVCVKFSENSWCRFNELEGMCSEINSKSKNIRGL